jgi:hypothetical protein
MTKESSMKQVTHTSVRDFSTIIANGLNKLT